MVFGVLIKATFRDPKLAMQNAKALFESGLDIARGGNGQTKPSAPAADAPAADPEAAPPKAAPAEETG